MAGHDSPFLPSGILLRKRDGQEKRIENPSLHENAEPSAPPTKKVKNPSPRLSPKKRSSRSSKAPLLPTFSPLSDPEVPMGQKDSTPPPPDPSTTLAPDVMALIHKPRPIEEVIQEAALKEAKKRGRPKKAEGAMLKKRTPPKPKKAAPPQDGVKRGRGRPKKLASLQSSVEFLDGTSASPEGSLSPLGGIAEPSTLSSLSHTLKRGRGRPKKAQGSASPASLHPGALPGLPKDILSPSEGTSGDSALLKRGRGRPKKVQTALSADAPSDASLAFGSESPNKRGRGRPKKDSFAPQRPISSSDALSSLLVGIGEKRGRGRPKKAEASSAPTSLGAKTRGHPPKDASSFPSLSEASSFRLSFQDLFAFQNALALWKTKVPAALRKQIAVLFQTQIQASESPEMASALTYAQAVLFPTLSPPPFEAKKTKKDASALSPAVSSSLSLLQARAVSKEILDPAGRGRQPKPPSSIAAETALATVLAALSPQRLAPKPEAVPSPETDASNPLEAASAEVEDSAVSEAKTENPVLSAPTPAESSAESDVSTAAPPPAPAESSAPSETPNAADASPANAPESASTAKATTSAEVPLPADATPAPLTDVTPVEAKADEGPQG